MDWLVCILESVKDLEVRCRWILFIVGFYLKFILFFFSKFIIEFLFVLCLVLYILYNGYIGIILYRLILMFIY